MACLSNGVFAQGLGVGVGPGGPRLSGFGEVNVEATIDYWIESNLASISPQMDLQISQIVDACQLNESEAKKLRFAVKGVVTRRINACRQQIKEFMLQSGLLLGDDNEINDEEDPLAEVNEANKIVFYSAGLPKPGVVDLKTYFVQPLVSHPLWNKTINKTLTAKQFEKYKEYRIGRNRGLMQTAISSWLTTLDNKVFLREPQRQKIEKHLQSKLEPHVSIESPRTLAHAEKIVKTAFSDPNSLGELLNLKQTEVRSMLVPRKNAGSTVSWGSPNH